MTTMTIALGVKSHSSRTERPHILWKDGKPEYLFLANHGSREAGFYLKIENWK